MKVVQLVASPKQGGMEKHVVELSNGINQLNTEVVVIADKSFAPYLNKSIKLIEIDFKRSRYNPFLLISILRLIKKINPDIIHCHGGKASQIISLLKPLLKYKCISTIHGIKKNVGYLKNFHHIIGVSNYIKNRLPKSWISTTIYNGIEKPKIITSSHKEKIKSSLNIPSSSFLWVAVGRLVPVKGFDQIIKAMQQVNGHLIIVGDGPEYSHLQELIETLSLGSRVTLTGHRNDAQEIIQCADQLIISSLREGFSYVFLEAMLTHTPVIASDVPVANEVLPKELIYPIGNHEELAKLMNRALSQPYNLKDIMDNCNTLMTLDSMVKATYNLYLKVLEAGNR